MTTTAKERELVMNRLMQLGLTWDDAAALRRISMTLHRWHELECGDGNNYGSWAIERDESDYIKCKDCKTEIYTDGATQCPNCKGTNLKQHKATGLPMMVHHHYLHGQGKDYTTRTRIPDKEAGAIKRLTEIMKRYQNLIHYVQTDPRGASLYILTMEQANDGGHPLDSIYNRGVAVY